MRVTGIFTGTTISPGGLLRQCPDRYTIRAGQNLPDKEFRYLRTVIVTAAVHRGFNSELSLLLLTFRHWAGVSPYTSSFDLAETCVFDKQSPGPILCGSVFRAPLLPKLRGHFAEFLNNPSPVGLRILSSSTCVGLRYGRHISPFLASKHRRLPYLSSVPFARRNQRPGSAISECQLFNIWRLRNFNRMCIDYASRPRLSSRLTLGGRTFPRKP